MFVFWFVFVWILEFQKELTEKATFLSQGADQFPPSADGSAATLVRDPLLPRLLSPGKVGAPRRQFCTEDRFQRPRESRG